MIKVDVDICYEFVMECIDKWVVRYNNILMSCRTHTLVLYYDIIIRSSYLVKKNIPKQPPPDV